MFLSLLNDSAEEIKKHDPLGDELHNDPKQKMEFILFIRYMR